MQLDSYADSFSEVGYLGFNDFYYLFFLTVCQAASHLLFELSDLFCFNPGRKNVNSALST